MVTWSPSDRSRHLVRSQSRSLDSNEVYIVETTRINPAIGVGTVGLWHRHDGPGCAAHRKDAAGAMTAAQQSNSQTDVALTREIRRAVVKDQSLSMLAHNVKIVSVNGSVTLLGPVKTEAEKDAIASKAQAIAGADKVHNQLEVKDQ